MLQSISQFVVRRRRAVLATWAVVILVGLVAGGSVMSRLATDVEGDPSRESVQVVERLEDLGFSALDAVAIVDGDVDDPAVEASVTTAAADITSEPPRRTCSGARASPCPSPSP